MVKNIHPSPCPRAYPRWRMMRADGNFPCTDNTTSMQPKETHTHRGEAMWGPSEEAICKPRRAASEERNLPAPWFWTFSLLNWEKKKFLLLSHLVCDIFLYLCYCRSPSKLRQMPKQFPREQMVTKWALSHRRLWFTRSFIEHGFYLLQKWVSWTRVRIYKILCRQRKIQAAFSCRIHHNGTGQVGNGDVIL